MATEAVGAQDPSTFHATDRIVGTYYFYWYDWNSTLHFFVQGKDALTNHPPNIQTYSYASVDWHRKELLDMMEAGLDFLLPVYWGDTPAKSWSIPGLDRLAEAQRSLIQEGVSPPKIGMFFDTTSLMVEHQHRRRPGAKPDLTAEEGKELFYGMIHDFFSHVPGDLWARMDGSAMVWLYSSGWVLAYDQSLVDYARARFREDFNSTLFIVRERSWNLDTEMRYGWGAALGPILLDVAAVGPGFSNEGAVRCYGQNPLHRDRLDGYAYRDDWEAALRSGSNIVVVETWNELHEGTEICETIELGRLYIDITANYSTIFRHGLWDPGLKEMDSIFSLEPGSLQGGPGERISVNLTIANKGFRSWPEHLDLGLYWLNFEVRNRTYNEVVALSFPRRMTTGDRYEERIHLSLPRHPGNYKLLASISYLGKKLELSVVVPDSARTFAILLIAACWAMIRRRPSTEHAGWGGPCSTTDARSANIRKKGGQL